MNPYVQRRLRRNIPVNYLFSFLLFTDLTRGVWMIFLAEKGFSLLQLGILESVFHITSFCMEVPTGAVADLWGRKVSRLAGRGLFLVSLSLMFFSTEFWLQICGFIVCAVNYNLESGAGEALVYDSLKSAGDEDRFMPVKGRLEFIIQSAAIVSFLLGGWLAVRNYALNFGLSALVTLGAVLWGLLLYEPGIERDHTASGGEGTGTGVVLQILRSLWRQTAGSLAVVRRRPRIAFFILFTELPFVFATTSFFYLQNYWKQLGRTEFYIGIVFALQCAVSGITGLLAPGIERRIGEKGILVAVPLLMTVCLWGIALTPLPAPFFISLGVLEGLLLVAVSCYINRLIPPEYRATILSYQSMVFSFFMILLFPVVGFLGERYGLASGFRFMAATGTLGVFGFLAALAVLKKRRPVDR